MPSIARYATRTAQGASRHAPAGSAQLRTGTRLLDHRRAAQTQRRHLRPARGHGLSRAAPPRRGRPTAQLVGRGIGTATPDVRAHRRGRHRAERHAQGMAELRHRSPGDCRRDGMTNDANDPAGAGGTNGGTNGETGTHGGTGTDGAVGAYLDLLLVELRGSARGVRRILSEVEEHLRDATAEGIAAGLTSGEAQRQAIERFGPPRTVARRFGRAAPPPGRLIDALFRAA